MTPEVVAGPLPGRRSEPPTPTFLLLGVGKSGTTALMSDLRRHPDVYVSEPEEPGFFDGPAYEEHDLGWYRETYYAGWRGEAAAGEGTSQTLFVPFTAERVAATLPDARLLAILRHPVDRAFSHWWMFRCFGLEALDFEAAVTRNLERLDRGEGFAGPDGVRRWYRYLAGIADGRLTERVYVDYGHYGEQLDRYLRHFPRERLEVILFQRYVAEREATLRRVRRHVEVDPDAPLPERAREGRRYGSRTVFRLTQVALRTGVQYLVPRPVRRWINRSIRRIGSPPEMDPGVRKRLLAHYDAHNRRLEETLGRKLPEKWRA